MNRIRTAALGVAVIASLTLAGCVAGVKPSASPTPTPTPSVSKDPWGKAPKYFPEGTAIDNKPLFDWVLGQAVLVWSDDYSRSMAVALTEKGFNLGAMQMTKPTSGTGNPADSVIISVQFGDSCLIGQRMLSGEYTSTIESALTSGGCLLGKLRKVDW